MKLNFRSVCIFWGILDVLYIVRFIWLNAMQGRIPLIDDIISFSQISSGYGDRLYITIMFILSLVLTISIIFSAVLLLLRWRKVHVLIYAQIPFRLLLVVPSLSFAPWLLKQINLQGMFVLILILIVSELLKVGSFILAKGNRDE
ncbi:hypothetical protein D0N50_20360 [Erwinia billingiae]|uniref:hypothetical protein n=1 Tax=Erwinia billingiae TaxID=182337 RepID=UPI001243E42D|nr:hypothetical protein [Erwinia billingiae]QEW33886.1 hypothetical protein D0N50_20360 [Erwinia billingiae]